MKKRAFVIVAMLGSAYCGGSSSSNAPPSARCTSTPTAATEQHSVDSIGENVDVTCASVAGHLSWKMQATGSACNDPIDCSPVCCACANARYHTLASWCDHGTCAAPEAVCCMVLGSQLGSSCGQ